MPLESGGKSGDFKRQQPNGSIDYCRGRRMEQEMCGEMVVKHPDSDIEPGGIRTHDPRIKSPLLYQLSYRPTFSFTTVPNCYIVSGSQRVAFVLTSRGFDTLILSLCQSRCNSSSKSTLSILLSEQPAIA
jgi:hypothetical protein